MQFALRHPERVSALVLAVPAAYPTQLEQRSNGATPQQLSSGTKILFDSVLKSDFLLWAAFRLAPDTMIEAFLATPSMVVESASAGERQRVKLVMDHLMPFSQRRLGVLNDAAITPFLPRYDLEKISAPALVIGTADDLYGTYAGARNSAAHIPEARFIGYPTGGHLMVGHGAESAYAIVSFLAEKYAKK